MLAFDRPAAHIQGRRKPTIYAQRLNACCGANNIDDGIHTPHLVEVYLFNGDGVDGRLCFAQKLEGTNGTLFHSLGKRS